MKTIFTTTRYGLKRIQISTKTDPTITPKPIKDDVPLLTSTEFFSFLGSIGLIYSFCIVLISISILHPSEFIYGLSFSKEIFSIAVIETFGNPDHQEEIIPDNDINLSLYNPQCEALAVYADGEKVGGVVVKIGSQAGINWLDLFYVYPDKRVDIAFKIRDSFTTHD